VKIVLRKMDQFDKSDFKARAAAIDAITAYGDVAIPALIQISEESQDTLLREWALKAITKIKEG
jgi:Na+/H+ antiporter NhaA